MRSVADDLRRETRNRVLSLPVAERIALALSLGDEDLWRYVAHTGVDAERARRLLREQRTRGRVTSRVAGDSAL